MHKVYVMKALYTRNFQYVSVFLVSVFIPKDFSFHFFYFIVGRDVILPLHRYVKSILGSPFLRFSRDKSFDKKNMPFAYDAFMKSDNHLTASVKIHEYSIVFQFSFLLLLDCRQTQICSY